MPTILYEIKSEENESDNIKIVLFVRILFGLSVFEMPIDDFCKERHIV